LVNPAKIFLGRIVDADELYINGTKVGATGYLYPQRRYAIADDILKPGQKFICCAHNQQRWQRRFCA
jgi:sialate O-acetylesterase